MIDFIVEFNINSWLFRSDGALFVNGVEEGPRWELVDGKVHQEGTKYPLAATVQVCYRAALETHLAKLIVE